MYKNDDQFEELIESHMSAKADEHIQKLDQRMTGALDSAPETSVRARKPVVGKTPAFRMALSHAVIAIAFFGIGFYIQQGNVLSFSESAGQSDTMSTTQMESSPATEESDFELPMANESTGVSIGNFGAPKQLDAREVEALAQSYQSRFTDAFNGRIGTASDDESVSSTAADQDASSSDVAAGASAAQPDASEPPEAVASLTTDRASLLTQRIAEFLGIYAEQQDGYIYALTETSLMRLRMEHAEVLIDDLQAPAGWGFDDEGKIVVVDQVNQTPIVLQLAPNRAHDEESEQ